MKFSGAKSLACTSLLGAVFTALFGGHVEMDWAAVAATPLGMIEQWIKALGLSACILAVAFGLFKMGFIRTAETVSIVGVFMLLCLIPFWLVALPEEAENVRFMYFMTTCGFIVAASVYLGLKVVELADKKWPR